MRNPKAPALIAGALLCGAALPAAAQTPAPMPTLDLSELMEFDRLVVEPFGLRANQLEGMDVYGADGDEVGEIEEILVNRNREFVAVVIEVDRYLGLVDREVVVPIAALQRAGDRFAVNMTEEELEQLPEWDDHDDD